MEGTGTGSSDEGHDERMAMAAAEARARRRGVTVMAAFAVLAVALGAVWWVRQDRSAPPAPVTAIWYLADRSAVTPDSTRIDVVVVEQSCAGGSPAYGRIVDDVRSTDDEVAIDIRVRPLGEASCPTNPPTAFVVELDEPLGDRTLVGDGPEPTDLPG